MWQVGLSSVGQQVPLPQRRPDRGAGCSTAQPFPGSGTVNPELLRRNTCSEEQRLWRGRSQAGTAQGSGGAWPRAPASSHCSQRTGSSQATAGAGKVSWHDAASWTARPRQLPCLSPSPVLGLPLQGQGQAQTKSAFIAMKRPWENTTFSCPLTLRGQR